MRYTSEEFFHFVGLRDPTNHDANFETLVKILDSSLLSFPPHKPNDNSRSITWEANIEAGELLVEQVVCFCDIPKESHEIHLRKYGYFGISFPRRFLVIHGARPVMYVPLQSRDIIKEAGSQRVRPVVRDWMISRKGFYDLAVAEIEGTEETRTLDGEPRDRTDAILRIDDLLTDAFFAYLKVYNANLRSDSPENFYMEREWRKVGQLSFAAKDVGTIVVHPDYFSKLVDLHPKYAVKTVRSEISP